MSPYGPTLWFILVILVAFLVLYLIIRRTVKDEEVKSIALIILGVLCIAAIVILISPMLGLG